jgi:hypothetical protein
VNETNVDGLLEGDTAQTRGNAAAFNEMNEVDLNHMNEAGLNETTAGLNETNEMIAAGLNEKNVGGVNARLQTMAALLERDAARAGGNAAALNEMNGLA